MEFLQASHMGLASGDQHLIRLVKETMEAGSQDNYLNGQTKHEDVLKWSGLVEDIAQVHLVHAEMFQPIAKTQQEETKRSVLQGKYQIMVAVGCCRERAYTLAKNLQRRICSPEAIRRAEEAAAAAEEAGCEVSGGTLWDQFVSEMIEQLGPEDKLTCIYSSLRSQSPTEVKSSLFPPLGCWKI